MKVEGYTKQSQKRQKQKKKHVNMSMIMNVMKNAIDVGKKEKHHIDGKKQVVKKQRDVEDVGRQKGKHQDMTGKKQRMKGQKNVQDVGRQKGKH